MENSTEAISDLTQQVNKLEAENKVLEDRVIECEKIHDLMEAENKALREASDKLAPWVSASMSKDEAANWYPGKEYLDDCNNWLKLLSKDRTK